MHGIFQFLRTRAHRTDWGLWLAVALAFVAAWPFLARPGLPHQTDAELHVYRAAELGHTLRNGALYPRWAPDLYYGYGYPIFNYYAPLTYYLANALDVVPGVDIVSGVKGVFVLGLLAASVGAYLLGRELFGPAPGVVAAAAITFSPYLVFIDPHARGDLAEHFAVCLMPLALYSFHRLMGDQGGGGAFVGSVVTLAAMVLGHALLGLVAGLLLLGYWVWIVMLGPGRRRAGWGLLAFVLASAIAAFYWLPFLLERNAIKLNVTGMGHFDFHEHFLSPSELLAPSRILDWGATAPRFRYNLGLAQWLLALPAVPVLVLLLLRKLSHNVPHARVYLAFFLLTGLGLIFWMLPVSTFAWERVPGVSYLQFPWRLLGPANVVLAPCAAAGLLLLPSGWRSSAAAVCVLAVLLAALPVLYPPAWDSDFGGVEPLDIIAWEQQGSFAIGTTSTGDFEPVGAALVPMQPAPSLLASYKAPGPVDRVNRATLPDGASVDIVEQRALYDRYAVDSPDGFVLRLYLFHFPGWRAYVDGEVVEIDVAHPEGFITFWVPAGRHEVVVRFEDTLPRTLGWIVSAMGLAVLAIVLIWRGVRGSGRSSRVTLDRQASAWLGSAVLVFVLVKAAVVDPHEGWAWLASPPGQALAAQQEVHVNFGKQIELLGYDLQQTHVHPGDAVHLVLYWRALVPLEKNYQTFVHVARPLDRVWAQEDHLNPGMRHGGVPTTLWPLDKYVWDEYDIPIGRDVPSGEYQLNVGLYLMHDGTRLEVYDDAGQVVGDGYVISLIEVGY
jgi:hypothetical protein